MTKEAFLKELQNKLEILTEEAWLEEQKIITTQIEDAISKGMTEEEAIKSLGNINTIKEQILKKHGINPQKVTKKKSVIYREFEELFSVIHKVVDVMSQNTLQENAKIILDILILIFLICLIKIPFLLIENLGDGLFEAISSPIATTIWGLAIDFVYIIVAIMVFMNVFTKWFKNLKLSEPKKKKKETSKMEMPKQAENPTFKGKELDSVTLTEEQEENDNES